MPDHCPGMSRRLSVLCVGISFLGSAISAGQDYPAKPIRILGPEPGSGIDFQVRLIAPTLTERLGQQVIVDNRAPAVVVETAARSPADGYTLIAGASLIWITPLLRKTAYDPIRDFAPITLMSSSPFVLVVHPSLPVQSVKDLIALAKARPGQLNYASATPGGGSALSAELFKSMAGVDIVGIPYKGSVQGMAALMTGEVQVMVNTAATTLTQVKAGRLRALAVTSAKPTPLAPGLPTVAAAGLPGYESAVYVGMLAPAGTPGNVINRLNLEIVRALGTPDMKEKFFAAGADVATSTPAQFGAKIQSEIAKWGKLIKDANRGN